MSEQLDLPLPRQSVRSEVEPVLDQIDAAIRSSNYTEMVRLVGLFCLIVWDNFYSRHHRSDT